MSNRMKNTLFDKINALIVCIVLLTILWPLLYIVSASISDPMLVNKGKVLLIPKALSLEAYKRVFQNNEIWIGYRNTIFYTVVGTLLNLVLTFSSAFVLSKRDLVGKKFFMLLFIITMFFNGGIIPTYLVVKKLDLLDKVWSIIIPNAISVWNVILVINYFTNEIPYELQEASKIDGCSNYKQLVCIMLPLAKPLIGVMALFYGASHWNNYFNALIYISNRDLYPLQLFLREILIQNQMSDSMKMSGNSIESMAKQAQMAQSIKYAVAIVSTLPVLIVFPFVQEYFQKGLMAGAIKG